MNLAKEVTLVIPARNRPNLTQKLLDSLNDTNAQYKIIFVDDNTEIPLSKQLPSYPNLRLKHIYNKTNIGPAGSRNIGIWNAQTPFIAFTDNDVTVSQEWMPALYNHLKNTPPDVAGVGGKVVDDDTNYVGLYSTRLNLLNPFTYHGKVIYVVTANCMFRRAALMEIGGFDESFKTPGGEDPNISFRLLQAGYRLEYEASAKVIHHYAASWWGFYKMFHRYGRGCQVAMRNLLRSE